MKLVPPGALGLAGLLALGAACSSAKVERPAPPPEFEPRARAAAPETAAVDPVASPAVEPQAFEPLAAASAALQEVSGAPGASPAKTEEKPQDKASSDKGKARPDAPLGWIAGQPLEAAELLLEWGDMSSRDLFLVLDKLVASRLALAESARLGIRMAPEEVDRRYAAEREKLAQSVARGGKAKSLEEFIERELGFDPQRYLERVRRATIRQMLAERAVRATSLSSETVALRLIVVANGEQQQQVTEALAAGRDFAEVVREFSADASKDEGGLVPFVVAQERSPLARLAFQTPVGETAGPLPYGDHQFWIRVEERRAPLEGDWSAIGAAVEASLERFPVGDTEFVNWKLVMESRYPIDLGPLKSLIGAAR